MDQDGNYESSSRFFCRVCAYSDGCKQISGIIRLDVKYNVHFTCFHKQKALFSHEIGKIMCLWNSGSLTCRARNL